MFFCNLAVCAFNFSEPMPPMVTRDKDYDVILMGPLKTIPQNFNTWTRITVKGPKTLKDVIEDVKKQFGFTISTMTCNGVEVYIGFIPKYKRRLD
jgi:ubiquitin-activating enzyme E1